MAIGILDDGNSWAVDTHPLYVPSYNNLKIDHESIQGADTGRTEDGIMHIDWVRRDVVKVYLYWGHLTGNEVAYLQGLLQGKEFTLKYVDSGSVKTAYCYCSKVSFTRVSSNQYSLEGGLCSDIEAHCIEM